MRLYSGCDGGRTRAVGPDRSARQPPQYGGFFACSVVTQRLWPAWDLQSRGMRRTAVPGEALNGLHVAQSLHRRSTAGGWGGCSTISQTTKSRPRSCGASRCTEVPTRWPRDFRSRALALGASELECIMTIVGKCLLVHVGHLRTACIRESPGQLESKSTTARHLAITAGNARQEAPTPRGGGSRGSRRHRRRSCFDSASATGPRFWAANR